MARELRAVWKSEDGAIAPTIGVSLFGLVAAAGIAFDYSRMATLDTELQNAADQAALAAATQLDGRTYACSRAKAAARRLIENQTYLANDGTGTRLWIDDTVDGSGTVNSPLTYVADDCAASANITFYESYDNAADTYGAQATSDATANVVEVSVGGRSVNFALTPIVAAISSGNLRGNALASMTSAICKTPPVMLCNPDEPVGNTNELLDHSMTAGEGIRLVTGDASVPGNFGWLEAGLGNGTQALAGALGYNTPGGYCQASGNVTTKTGMDTAVLQAFNTRFDIYANGNTTCPAQGGGTCSPAINTRKDLICEEKLTAGVRTCKNDGWAWVGKDNGQPALNDPYDPWWDSDGDGTSEHAFLPADGATPMAPGTLDPKLMGFPHDLCHSSLRSRHNCSPEIRGDGSWDRDAYFRVNYKWPASDYTDPATGVVTQGWQARTGLSATASRYEVYKWEEANQSFGTAPNQVGILHDQQHGASKYWAFARPASGVNGVGEDITTGQPDRRTIAVAVLNCRALDVKGKTVDVPVAKWVKVFLVEPAWSRNNSGKGDFTDQKDIYVEFIEDVEVSADTFAEVVRRDKPYLLR